jgi:hypothetical protein
MWARLGHARSMNYINNQDTPKQRSFESGAAVVTSEISNEKQHKDEHIEKSGTKRKTT